MMAGELADPVGATKLLVFMCLDCPSPWGEMELSRARVPLHHTPPFTDRGHESRPIHQIRRQRSSPRLDKATFCSCRHGGDARRRGRGGARHGGGTPRRGHGGAAGGDKEGERKGRPRNRRERCHRPVDLRHHHEQRGEEVLRNPCAAPSAQGEGRSPKIHELLR